MGDRVGQFNMNYRPGMTIKGHALTDFIAEFIYYDTTKVAGIMDCADVVKEVETEKGITSAVR